MKVGVCTKTNHIELQDRPVPEVHAGSVLVRVSVCGICGSDVAAWRGSGHKKYPYSPGHEFCGIVEQVGEGVSAPVPGQRVVIDPNLGCGKCRFCRMGKPNLCDYLKSRPIKSNGGLAEFVTLDHRMVHPLPETVPDELAPFIEPLSCALHATDTAEVKSGERVAVFGAGLMGILTGMALGSIEADCVFVEPAENRRERAFRLLNLKAVSPEELARSDLVGKIDAAIDCSGSGRAVAQAICVLRKAGRLILGGIVMDPDGAGISFIDITTKELQIKGVWLNPNTFARAVDLAAARVDVLEKMERQTFSLKRLQAAFKRAASPDAAKILVKP